MFVNFNKINKNFVILLTEITVIFLMVLNVLPREAALFLTGLLIFFFIFSPLEDALWVFIASIPLFIALPITDSFDSMANWRILLLILFLKAVFAGQIPFFTKIWTWRRGELSRLTILTSIFLAIGALSLISAADFIVGFKKILYFINIFMLFFVVREAIRDKKSLLKIFQAAGLSIGLVLAAGYIQLTAVFFTPLYAFWQFWAKNVISVFYGGRLSELLSFSNTWFSYYSNQAPTLRMFSIFPDSHSFALFCLIGLPFLLTAVFFRPKNNKKLLFILYPILIIILSALVFSGSRGIWASALIPLAFSLIYINLSRITRIINIANRYFRNVCGRFIEIGEAKIFQLFAGSLVIFFLLFPISSLVLFFSQKAQIDNLTSEDSFLVFERARSIVDFSEVSAKTRLEIWQKTVESIVAHPILGVGIGNYPVILGENVSAAKRGASAHNLYLDTASEMGVFALLILLVIFWEILKTGWRFYQRTVFCQNREQFSGIWAGFFCLVLIWILSYSLFDIVLLNDKVLLFFTAVLGILYANCFSKSFNL